MKGFSFGGGGAMGYEVMCIIMGYVVYSTNGLGL